MDIGRVEPVNRIPNQRVCYTVTYKRYFRRGILHYTSEHYFSAKCICSFRSPYVCYSGSSRNVLSWQRSGVRIFSFKSEYSHPIIAASSTDFQSSSFTIPMPMPSVLEHLGLRLLLSQI